MVPEEAMNAQRNFADEINALTLMPVVDLCGTPESGASEPAEWLPQDREGAPPPFPFLAFGDDDEDEDTDDEEDNFDDMEDDFDDDFEDEDDDFEDEDDFEEDEDDYDYDDEDYDDDFDE
jgi:hypothetical protein